MIPLAHRVRRRSLDRWYLAAAGEPARRHLVWQSPFALAGADEPPARRSERIRIAGGLWLRNFDLRFAGQLWLVDEVDRTTWAFRRYRRPGEQNLIAGPLSGILIEGGRQIFRSAVRFRETDDRELDALLLSAAPDPT